MTGIDDRLAGGAAQVTAELPGQLPGALYRAARGASAGLAGEQGETAVQVGAAATLYVTFAEQRRYVASQFAKAEGLAAQQQVGNARMGRQFGHRLAMGTQRAAGVQRPQPPEQLAGLGVGRRGRRVEPGQLLRRHAPARQLQGQPGQIGLEDFRRAVGRQLLMLALRPQAVAYARLQAPCAAGTLGSGGAGDALGLQAGHATARIEARHPRQAGVDHHPYAVDGQAGLGDVGRQHHLARAPRRRLDGGALGGEVELAMQRAEQHLGASAKGFAQAFVNAADLGLAGKKDQHAAAFLRQRLEHRLLHPRLDELAGLRRPSPADIHREHAALAAHHRRFAEQRRKTLALQGRRHHQHFQRRLVAQQFAAIESQRQGQVGIQAALVEFVEDHQADTVQRRVVLQATGKDTLGDHFDAGLRADPALQADPVADGLADLFAQLGGQPLGRGPRRQAPRFEHEDALAGEPGLVEQGQRHAGGLAGARRGFQNGLVLCAKGLAQGGNNGVDG